MRRADEQSAADTAQSLRGAATRIYGQQHARDCGGTTNGSHAAGCSALSRDAGTHATRPAKVALTWHDGDVDVLGRAQPVPAAARPPAMPVLTQPPFVLAHSAPLPPQLEQFFTAEQASGASHAAAAAAGTTDGAGAAAAKGSVDRRGLHLACHKGNRKMLQYLLTLKPDLEVTTHLLQLTPLHCAVNAKATACVKLLLESGADFEAQTDTGERALHIAIQRMDLPTLKVLIDAGVDKYAPALSVWEGGVPRTPIELARLLPAPFSDSIEKLLRMTHKQRQVCVRCPPWVLICALAFLPACLFA